MKVEFRCQLLANSPLCLLPQASWARSAQLAGNAGHHDTLNSTRYDQIEVAEIGADVESKAMECDPLLHVNPDAGNLAAARPHASQPRIRSCHDAELCQGLDQTALEATQVPVKVLAMLPQIDDGVTHKLARTMISDVTTALHFEHRYPTALQHCSANGEALGAGAASQRDNRLVLDQQQHVLVQLTRQPFPAELPLKLQHLTVGPAAEIVYDKAWVHAPRAKRLA